MALQLQLWARWVYSSFVRLLFMMVWRLRSSRPLLPPIADPLLALPAHTLALWIRQGKVTSEAVVSAYIERIRVVNPLLNAVVDDRFDAALEDARAVDARVSGLTSTAREELADTHPLLGVPFTAKESVMVQGMSHTGGLVTRVGTRAEEDALVVHRLRMAGGIPLGVSNVPELGLWWETSNCVYSTTAAAHDFAKTPGGSSGGEATLLAAYATPLSVGTDVGGSIRMPSHCSGVFGHKPTSGWVPLKGAGIFAPKLEKGGVLVAGPMARTVQDLILVLRVMAPSHTEGIQEKIEGTKLDNVKVWWLKELASPRYSPVDTRLGRLLRRVMEHLRIEQGMTTAKFPVDLSSAFHVWNNKMSYDYEGEPEMSVDMTNRKGEANLWKEWLWWLCGRGRHTFPVLTRATMVKMSKKQDLTTSPHYWKTYQDACMEVLGADGVLIMPVIPIVSPYHHEPLFNTFDFCYCGIFNAVEFPSTAVPLPRAQDGSPMALQVVATPGNDHLCLAVASALEKKFGGCIAPSSDSLTSKKDS